MKLNGLEGLRGLMCLWVIISHTVTMAALPIYENQGLGRLIAKGSYAVDVFIILSGFAITYLLLIKNENYKLFIFRRFLRLFPAYIVALFLSLLIFKISIDFLTSIPFHHPKTISRLEIFQQASHYFYENISTHIFLAHGLLPYNIVPNGVFAIIGQAWSLSLEWQFYLAAPFLVFYLIKSKGLVKKVTIVLFLIFIEVTSFKAFGHKSFLFSNIMLFIYGLVCCSAYLELKNEEINVSGFIRKILLWSSIFIIYKFYRHGVLHLLPIMIWAFSLISLTLKNNFFIFKFTNTFLTNTPVQWLGMVSYSAYCIHMISLYICGYFFVCILTIDNHVLYASLMSTIPLLLTLYISHLMYKYIEKPPIDFGKSSSLFQQNQPVKYNKKVT